MLPKNHVGVYRTGSDLSPRPSCASRSCRARGARPGAVARTGQCVSKSSRTLFGAMPRLALANHKATLHVEGGEQSRRAWRLRANQGLYLVLFIAPRERAVWRIHESPTTSVTLTSNVRIIRDFEPTQNAASDLPWPKSAANCCGRSPSPSPSSAHSSALNSLK